MTNDFQGKSWQTEDYTSLQGLELSSPRLSRHPIYSKSESEVRIADQDVDNHGRWTVAWLHLL
jgi:hypothetical protein